MIECPHCSGTGKVDVPLAATPTPLSPLQHRIYDLLVRFPDGLSVRAIIKRVYPAGAPRSARNSVWVTICNTNKRLAPHNQRIVSRGGWCRLQDSSK